jgi:16S rRNA G1207 methylase RsmC
MQMQSHYFTNDGADFEPQLVDTGDAIIPQAYTARGVFSSGGIDKGTRVLLDYIKSARGMSILEDALGGHKISTSGHYRVLDMGAGWGVISLYASKLLQKIGGSVQITALDVNRHALELVKLNAKMYGAENITTAEILPEQKYDIIVSNPPIRIGKAELHALLTSCLDLLMPNTGVALLVVQKNLGSDSLLKWLNVQYSARKLSSTKGFRIIEVRR